MNTGKAARCWHCEAELVKTAETRQGIRLTPPASFRLSSLMLTVALISCCLALVRLAPGLSILLVALVGPAYVRTANAARVAHANGRLLPPLPMMGLFLESIGVVSVIVILTVAAFAVVCVACVGTSLVFETSLETTSSMPLFGLASGIAFGAIAAFGTGFLAVKKLWLAG